MNANTKEDARNGRPLFFAVKPHALSAVWIVVILGAVRLIARLFYWQKRKDEALKNLPKECLTNDFNPLYSKTVGHSKI